MLLKNDGPVLPLARGLAHVAVFGRLADLDNTGDFGSSRGQPPYVVTPLAGLRETLGNGVSHAGDEADPGAAGLIEVSREGSWS